MTPQKVTIRTNEHGGWTEVRWSLSDEVDQPDPLVIDKPMSADEPAAADTPVIVVTK